MRLWFLNTLVFASGYGMLAWGALFWRDATLAGLTSLLMQSQVFWTILVAWLALGERPRLARPQLGDGAS